ncbi:MAG: L-threonylcarbamoyladenylate synthase [Patescibacteria group bacterium]
MKIIKIADGCLSKAQLAEVVNVLKNDGVIVYPTDTVYGLGGSAMSPVAVDKIIRLKERLSKDVFSVMVDSIDTIKKYAQVGLFEEEFLKKYLPGPVTVVLKLKEEFLFNKRLVPEVINIDGATGWRVVNTFDFLPKLCRQFGLPIVSTSANKSKQGKYESNIEFVLDQFRHNLKEIDIILDAGLMRNNLPSTVVDLSKSPYLVLRRGAEDISDLDLNKQ